ncbi:MAG: glycine zipper 2TM domain-containing protein [Betaproteobacteria bacterium]|nr:glycine zipper 2TM domain-containing protein [Betaproteobacteria bacterium]
MKRMLTVAVLSTLGVGAMTVQAAEFADTAQVISATPIYDRVSSPRRECVNEPVTTYEERRVRREYPDAYRENRDYRSSSNDREGTGAGAVLGAIIGGVIGHQFGNSSGGRDRGTAAGAVLGGVIGHQIEKDGNNEYRSTDSPYRRSRYDVERVPVTRDVQRCNVVNDYREEVRGYDVRYRYNGRDYTTRLSYDPGPTIPVQVEVRPAYRAGHSNNDHRGNRYY